MEHRSRNILQPDIDLPLTAFIVVHWLNIEDTEACLKSLMLLNYPALDVILVNNGSPDFDAERFRTVCPSVVIITLDENQGFTGGNNAGITIALQRGADLVFLLNNDAVVRPGLMQHMLPVLQQQNVGIVGPTITYFEKPEMVWFCGGIYSNFLGYSFRRRQPDHQPSYVVDWVNGCAMGIKRDVLEAIGDLWEPFYLNYEDVEFCLRARKYGFESVQLREPLVLHKVSSSGGISGTDLLSPDKAYYFARNQLWLLRRQARGIWKITGFLSQFLVVLPYWMLLNGLAGNGHIITDYFQGLRAGLKSQTGKRPSHGTLPAVNENEPEHWEPLSISVVIRTYTEARWEFFIQAVESVNKQTLPPTEIVLVVDHNPELLERVHDRFPEALVVENQRARGSSEAWNSGIENASGDIIAFLDDDAIAAPDWLEKLTSVYKNPHVVASGGDIEPVWISKRPGWFPDEFLWIVGCTYRGLPRQIAPVRNLIGCNMSFRRTVFEEIGKFRSDLGHQGQRTNGNEETELCIRVHQRLPGSLIMLVPAACVHHMVPKGRATWHYFRYRCYLEGESKARVSQLIGMDDGLSSERAYVLRTLPTGVLNAIRDTILHRDLDSLKRSSAIITGFSITLFAYGFNRLRIIARNLRSEFLVPETKARRS